MKPPPGFFQKEDSRICRLQKSHHGLKQASQQWFSKLSTTLLTRGFLQSGSNHSLFTYNKGQIRLFVLIYIDDLCCTETPTEAKNPFRKHGNASKTPQKRAKTFPRGPETFLCFGNFLFLKLGLLRNVFFMFLLF